MIDCKKFAAVGAVFVMMAVAFAGITFLSEEADSSNTYSALTSDLHFYPTAGDVLTITDVQSVTNPPQYVALDSSTNTVTITVPSVCTPPDHISYSERFVICDTSGKSHTVWLSSNQYWPLTQITDFYPDTMLYVVNGTNVSYTATYDEDEGDDYYLIYEKITSVTSGVGLTLDSSGNLSGIVSAPVDTVISIDWARKYEYRYDGGNLNESGIVTLKVVSLETKHDHKITYSGNGNTGGSTVNTVVTASGTDAVNVTLASNGFTKTGYTFTGWLVNGTVYQPGATISVAADATVTATAQWSQNTVTASAGNTYGKTNISVVNQITASANNGGSITSYAVKSVTGGSASVSTGGLVTYNCPSVTATATYQVTVTVTGTFSDGSTLSKDVTFKVVVDPIFAFTKAVTSGSLTVKGAGA